MRYEIILKDPVYAFPINALEEIGKGVKKLYKRKIERYAGKENKKAGFRRISVNSEDFSEHFRRPSDDKAYRVEDFSGCHPIGCEYFSRKQVRGMRRVNKND